MQAPRVVDGRRFEPRAIIRVASAHCTQPAIIMFLDTISVRMTLFIVGEQCEALGNLRWRTDKFSVTSPAGFEPAQHRLKVGCSAS